MTKAARAREAAQLTVQEAAKRARIGISYLRQVERHGAPFYLARRLSAIYECPIVLFLGEETPSINHAERRGGSRRRAP